MDEWETLRTELERFSSELASKEALVVVNKLDLYGGASDQDLMHLGFEEKGLADGQLPKDWLAISGVSGEGLEVLKEKIVRSLLSQAHNRSEVREAQSESFEPRVLGSEDLLHLP
jgi:GTPase involved in cell partitioning and DNA repair